MGLYSLLHNIRKSVCSCCKIRNTVRSCCELWWWEDDSISAQRCHIVMYHYTTMWTMVFCFYSSAWVRTSLKESHNYSMIVSPALDQQPLFLILVSTSSAPFLLITGFPWRLWHAKHGFKKKERKKEKTSLQLLQPPNPTHYFPLDDALLIPPLIELVHLTLRHFYPFLTDKF